LKPLIDLLRRTGPLAPLLALWAGGLVLTTLDRLLLAAAFGDGALRWGLILTGWRMDAIILAQISALPLLLILLLPPRRAAWPAGVVLGLGAGLLLLGELASWPFLAEFGTRPGALFIRYLGHPREVAATLGPAYLAFAAVGGALVIALGAWTARSAARWLAAQPPWPWRARLAAGLVLVPLLALAGRSGLGEAVPTPALADFSDHRLSNQLAQNPAYSLAFAAYRSRTKKLRAEAYGHLPRAQIVRQVRAAMGLPEDAFIDPAIPTLHRQAARVHPPRPRNLVVILEESLGADVVGRLGGTPLTPELDRLAGEGLWFQRLYAIGTRTTWGMQGVVTGLPPTGPDAPLMKLPLAQRDFFTVAEALRRAGYATYFLYGGEAHFDDMATFLGNNGVQHVIDRRDFPAPRYLGRWGVSDEDLFDHAHRLFQAQDGPFAAILLTLSHHRPYDIPPGRVAPRPGERAEQTAARYADWALGRFLRQARAAPYGRETVFVVVADHKEKVHNRGLLPLEQFRIPGLILAPDLRPRVIRRVASQMDLLPTALPLLGVDLVHPMIGRDHLAEDPRPGRAMVQLGHTLGYLRGDDLVVLRPRRPMRQFRVHGPPGRPELERRPLQAALAREALAHALFPALVYHERAYRLPPAGH